MHDPVAVVLAAGLALFVLAAVVIIILSRKTHLRSWRFGLFYEAEDKFENGKKKEQE